MYESPKHPLLDLRLSFSKNTICFFILSFYKGKSAKKEPKMRDFQNLPEIRPKSDIHMKQSTIKVVTVFGFAPNITENDRFGLEKWDFGRPETTFVAKYQQILWIRNLIHWTGNFEN